MSPSHRTPEDAPHGQVLIRKACADELSTLISIDDDASTLYSDAGIDLAAESVMHYTRDEQSRWQRALRLQRVWLAVDASDRAWGFAAADMLDGVPYLDQLSVRTSAMRRGIGTRLLDEVVAWARERDDVLWLTTYDHLAWNQEFYSARGFELVAETQWEPGVARHIAEQRRHLPQPEHRIAMRRMLESNFDRATQKLTATKLVHDKDWLRDVCAEVGVALEAIDAPTRHRVALLAEHSETVSDGARISALAQAVFRFYDRHKPTLAFSEVERRTIVIGGLIADVGKTGPLHADEGGQRLIVKMFAVEGVRDEHQSVAQFFTTYFPEDADARVVRFRELGLDPQMSMRTFWNMHASWTLDIVENSGVPEEAIAAAATHHMLENINPSAIVAADGRFSRDFGDNKSFNRTEKLVILLDKYDAVLRRGGRTHEQAIAWLHELLEKHPRFSGDTEFALLVDDVDAAVREMQAAAQPSNLGSSPE